MSINIVPRVILTPPSLSRVKVYGVWKSEAYHMYFDIFMDTKLSYALQISTALSSLWLRFVFIYQVVAFICTNIFSSHIIFAWRAVGLSSYPFLPFLLIPTNFSHITFSIFHFQHYIFSISLLYIVFTSLSYLVTIFINIWGYSLPAKQSCCAFLFVSYIPLPFTIILSLT